jgi:hypothetical protein
MHEEWLGGGKGLVVNGTLEFEKDEKQLEVIEKRIG